MQNAKCKTDFVLVRNLHFLFYILHWLVASLSPDSLSLLFSVSLITFARAVLAADDRSER